MQIPLQSSWFKISVGAPRKQLTMLRWGLVVPLWVFYSPWKNWNLRGDLSYGTVLAWSRDNVVNV